MNKDRPFFLGVWVALVCASSSGCSGKLEHGSTGAEDPTLPVVTSATEANADPASVPSPSGASVTLDPGASARAVAAPIASTPNVAHPPQPYFPAGIRPPLYEPPPSNQPPPVAAAQPRPAVREDFHVAKAPVQKEPPATPARADVVAVAPEVIAKQNRYLQEWETLQTSVGALPPEEQEQRRSALKKATMGN